jgi:hypothetical protein
MLEGSAIDKWFDGKEIWVIDDTMALVFVCSVMP